MTKGRMSHKEMYQFLFFPKELAYMLNKQYMNSKYVFPSPLEITTSKNVYKFSLYFWENFVAAVDFDLQHLMACSPTLTEAVQSS